MKTELQMLYLSEDSRKMVMETLRSIHGEDFQLDNASKYKDRGGKMKKTYWEDRGTLLIQSATNYSIPTNGDSSSDNVEDRLRKYALVKLENYGFPLNHCVEAYDHCKGDTDAALLLLFRTYMRLSDSPNDEENVLALSEQELLDMREDEMSALESIYDKSFQVKENKKIWSLKFKIDHLLVHSPSEVRKAREAAQSAANEEAKKKLLKPKKEMAICRNFEKDGKCKFGHKCRFSHKLPEPEISNEDCKSPNKHKNYQPDDDNTFYLEIRFPAGTKYPYEPPYIFLKTTCHDIPSDIRLRIARRLYQEAIEICKDGMPCIYSISELLQMEQNILQSKNDANLISFPSPNKSLFYKDNQENNIESNSSSETLPSHYEKGQTSASDGFKRNSVILEKDNRNLLRKFLERQKDEKYQNMMASRQKLPAFAKIDEIINLIQTSQVITTVHMNIPIVLKFIIIISR